MLYPSMIRLTHIYTRLNAIFALKRAFKHGMELYYTVDTTDEMKLALCFWENGDPDLLFVTILTHLIENLSKNSKHLQMLATFLDNLEVLFPSFNWLSVYKNLMNSPDGETPCLAIASKNFVGEVTTYDHRRASFSGFSSPVGEK